MTVNTELSRAEFAWTGVESVFAAGFPADKAGDVRVFYRTPAGVISTLVNGVNYSVTLATGSKLVTIVPLSLPAAPGTVVVRRSTPALVTDTLQDGEGFSLEIIQRLHDIAAMRSAEDRDTLARAITLEEGAALGEGDFDFGGSGIANLAPGTSVTHAATVGQLQQLSVASGNVPAPVSGDTNRLLVATGPDAFAWLALATSMIPDGFFSADAAGRAKFADKLLTFAKLVDVSTGIVLGRKTAGTGAVEELSASDIRAIIATATGEALLVAGDAAAGRAAISASPLPKTGSGIGEFVAINAASGNAAVLPSGGTWAYCRFPRQTSTGTWAGGAGASIAAGGTTIASATADVQWHGFAWRIS